MDKKNYVKPNMVVVKLRYQEHLLDATSSDGARSLKWSETFDYE